MTATSRRHHVATSPRRDVTTSRRHHVATSPRRDVTTSRRHHVATSPRRDVTTSRRHHVATSPRHHVATSPSHDVGSKNCRSQQFSHVATSRRQLENLHLIIKCQRARKLGHWRTCDGRHENREQSNTAFKELLGF